MYDRRVMEPCRQSGELNGSDPGLAGAPCQAGRAQCFMTSAEERPRLVGRGWSWLGVIEMLCGQLRIPGQADYLFRCPPTNVPTAVDHPLARGGRRAIGPPGGRDESRAKSGSAAVARLRAACAPPGSEVPRGRRRRWSDSVVMGGRIRLEWVVRFVEYAAPDRICRWPNSMGAQTPRCSERCHADWVAGFVGIRSCGHIKRLHSHGQIKPLGISVLVKQLHRVNS